MRYAWTAREWLAPTQAAVAGSSGTGSSSVPARRQPAGPSTPCKETAADHPPPPPPARGAVMVNQFGDRDPAFIGGGTLLNYYGIKGQSIW